MKKIFLNYEQQLIKLQDEKKLNIPDWDYAREMLKRYSYYSLISGYKKQFKIQTQQLIGKMSVSMTLSLCMNLMRVCGPCF